MAKQVIWSRIAKQQRRDILKYWTQRNKSNEYSKKLEKLFKEASKRISQTAHIGRQSDDKFVRIKIVRDYLLIYEISNDLIFVLLLWDGRQNPERLKELLGK